MHIDAYYKFEKNNLRKSKTRYDLIFNQGHYEPLNQTNKNGECWIYFGNNSYIKTTKVRKSDLVISTKDGHLTSVFVPDYDKPNLAYGDFKNDALLIVINSLIEILVFRGSKHIQPTLNNLFLDGEFNDELQQLRDLSTASLENKLKLVGNDA